MKSTQKWLLSSAFLCSSLGCINIYAQNLPNSSDFGPYVYVGGQVGWGQSNWSDFTNLNADNNGIVYGGKLGYQANRRFGVEIGGFVLPQSDIGSTPLSGTVDSWVAYAAATFRFPLTKNERLFLRGKAGGAYRNLDHNGALFTDVGTGYYWTGIVGASLNYAFDTVKQPIIIGVEYSNIFGSSGSWTSHGRINENGAPSAQIVTATLSVALKV